MSLRRVLIVDSDQTTVRRLCSLFHQLPAEIMVAGSRSEATELCLRSTFSLCLISHGLIDGNGLPLLREVLWGRGAVLGVLMSRHADLRVIQQAIDSGYTHVVEQPLDLLQLRPLLQRVFGSEADGLSFEQGGASPCTNTSTEVPDLRCLASLSIAQIRSGFSVEELIRIIRTVDYPFAGKERLEYFDRDTLERVVCLVRRWCQQRLAGGDVVREFPASEPQFSFSADAAVGQENRRVSA